MRRVPALSAVRVSVPASTANLGSGFDTLGMALALRDTLWVRVLPRGLRVRVSGAGADGVPTDERHLVLRALRAAADRLGLDLPGVDLHAHNAIPHARGLGSSAAAVVGGIAAAYGLAGVAVDEAALQLAAEFDGHADNVAASMYGGLVVAFADRDEAVEHAAAEQHDAGATRYRAARLEPHRDIWPVALVPEVESATEQTRGLLPARVPHADAAFAASRAALAVHALTDAPELLLPATADRLHQHYREPAWPESVALVRALRAAGVAAAISGAGPTVLAFPQRGTLPEDLHTGGFAVWPIGVDRSGVTVEPAEND